MSQPASQILSAKGVNHNRSPDPVTELTAAPRGRRQRRWTRARDRIATPRSTCTFGTTVRSDGRQVHMVLECQVSALDVGELPFA